MASSYESAKEIPENNLDNIQDFESFETERGSVYKVMENGQVVRTKNILDNPNYLGEDKGEKKEKEPADVIVFYDAKKYSGWMNVAEVAKLIDIGVYKRIDERTYEIVRNSSEIEGDFIFLRVRRDDDFKLKEVFDFEELVKFQERTMDPKNKGLGVLIPSKVGDITNIPTVGLNTFDYRYDSEGQIVSMHNGNKVVSVKIKP